VSKSACPVSLNRNGDYWVAVWYTDADQRRRKGLGHVKKVSRTRALQKCWDLARRHAVNPRSRDVSKTPTLMDWGWKYLKLREPEVGTKMLAMDAKTLEYLEEFFGEEVRCDNIGPAGADDWRAFLLAKELTSSTVAGHVRRAKTCFGRLVKRGELAGNPFDDLSVKVPPVGKRVTVQDAWVPKLLDAAPGPAWRALIGLCALSGLRRSEALSLTWDAVRWGEARLVVTNAKTGKSSGVASREVRLEPELERILLDARDGELDRPCAIPSCDWHRAMVKIIREAGLAPWPRPFHALRDWRSTTWKKLYPEFVVDSWLGHSQEVARKHYNTVPEEFYSPTATILTQNPKPTEAS
jgi:integrase